MNDDVAKRRALLGLEEPKVLDFEEWAALEARLMSVQPEAREEAVHAAQLATEDWEYSEKHWLGVLAAEVARGEMDRAQAFGALCRAETLRREALPEEPPAVSKSEAAPPPSPIPMPVQHYVPSYLLPDSRVLDGPDGVIATSHVLDVDSTLEAIVDRGATLPFGVKVSAVFGDWLAAPKPREASEEPAEQDPLNATVALPLAGLDLGSPLPFAKESTAKLPTMPVELYASLCAALSMHPERTPEILARFGVSGDDARRDLDQTWREVFVKSPEQFGRWREAYKRFREALAVPQAVSGRS